VCHANPCGWSVCWTTRNWSPSARAEIARKQCSSAPQCKREDRLNNPTLRENFIERIYAYPRWQKTMVCRNSQALVEFHTHHKYLLLP
jgi:hypothetical protein